MKKIVSSILIFTLILAFVPSVNAAYMGGTCGDNVTWELVGGSLQISGTGKIDFNQVGYDKAWHSEEVREKVKTIWVKNGVTSICYGAFSDLPNMYSAELAESVTELQESFGTGTFSNCPSLKLVIFNGNIKNIPDNTFSGCSSLEQISVGYSVENYSSIEGVLYDKEETNLIYYPEGKRDSEFSIPITVETISAGINSPYLEEFKVSEYHDVFETNNSVLFNKLTHELVAYPKGNTRKSYSIPKGTTRISVYANEIFKNLEALFIPKSLTSMSIGCFGYSETLSDIYYEGTVAQWQELMENIGWQDGMEDYPPFTSTIHYNSEGIPAAPEKQPAITAVTAKKVGDNIYQITSEFNDITANCSLITATYDNGKMTHIDVTPLSEDYTNMTVTVSAEGKASAKVFIWNSLSDMKPLCEAKIIDL